MGSQQQQTVNITDLDLPSLQQVKTQLEEVRWVESSKRIHRDIVFTCSRVVVFYQELSHLTQSYGKLRGAQARFSDCADSVESLKSEKADGKIIALTPWRSTLFANTATLL